MRPLRPRGVLPAASALLLTALLGACGGPHPPAASAKDPSASARTAGPATSGTGPGAAASPGSTPAGTPAAGTVPVPAPAAALDALRRRYGARLGVYALDTGSGREIGYHADDRFAFDSTYKALAAGVLLRRASDADLDRVLTYRAEDLQKYSPVTRAHVSTGMTLRALLDAALRHSDNTAANLLLDRLGGPAGLQRALRGTGDVTTHVDRAEPDVNSAIPGDVRDTSTPRTLATDLRRFLLGDLLTARRRARLTTWMLHTTTGGPYIRAGVPAGWRVGDKTGNGDYGSRNDIAVVWPPIGAPVVLAILSARGHRTSSSDDALIADTTKAVLAALR
ncbi:class A beta-lactamase [Streptomyces fuscigenes]|uniref:class A beta-lactamase n=1 Tax=Streptomyces fuscigenes TaxID=1528880 RepID=UPI001EFF4B94|nr:class A beta-lactamase [Streptomyces fuscigenes]MCF3962655.1 class A beta-lactamase [Streptomyces fuscigenes]